MHIPDNYLSPATCAVMAAAMVPVWTVAVKKVRKEITKEKLPMLGVGAAFSFLIMMFNIPLPGGTTGHAVGGTLLAILFGPWAACISLTIALLVQALLFGDGGILSFGANCFNMAFVLPFTGYFVYKFIRERAKSAKGEYAGTVLGSYIGINVAALFAAVEFGLQPLLFKNAAGQPLYCPYPLSVTIPAMTIPHLLVAGVLEAVFTVGIWAFIKKVSPGTIYEGAKKRVNPIYAFIIGIVCLSPLGLLAVGTAWGEWGADRLGSMLGYVPQGMANAAGYSAPMPGYGVSGMPEAFGYILSAAAGAAILVIAFKLLSLARRNKRTGTAESGG